MPDRFTKTDLEKAKEATKSIRDKKAHKRMKNSRPDKKGSSVTDIFKSYGKYDGKPIELKGGGMSAGQKKLAAKAPPPNKIDAKDFAVLRAEKAKGRGMGLQDEKVQPGKVMKAKMGVATDYKKYLKGLKKATSEVKKNKGKGHYDKENVIRHIRINKKMGGGMMKKYSKGSEKKLMTPEERADYVKKAKVRLKATAESLTDKLHPKKSDRLFSKHKKMGGGMMKARRGRIVDDQKRDKRNPNRKPSTKIFDKIGDILKTPYYIRGGKKEKKMGGGMIGQSQRPGYSKGTMVKARGCKLGRTRPTKIT